jgi:hypothetical protein
MRMKTQAMTANSGLRLGSADGCDGVIARDPSSLHADRINVVRRIGPAPPEARVSYRSRGDSVAVDSAAPHSEGGSGRSWNEEILALGDVGRQRRPERTDDHQQFSRRRVHAAPPVLPLARQPQRARLIYSRANTGHFIPTVGEGLSRRAGARPRG